MKKIKLNNEDRNNLIRLFNKKRKTKSLLLKIGKILKMIESHGSVLIQNYPITDNNQLDFKKFSSLFGILHKQNLKGDQIIRIENKGKKWDAKNRGYKTNQKLDLHSDGGKISLLLCLSNFSNGGESIQLDSNLVFSKIKNYELKLKLLNGFKYHTRHEAKNGSIITKNKYPVFFYKKNMLHCTYNPKPIEEALKYTKNKKDLKIYKSFDKIISQLKNKCKIFKIKPGEVWIVNNYKILHGRKKFKEISGKRLLLRSWVSPKNFKFSGKTILDAYNDR